MTTALDPTRIVISTDPLTRRMTGTTAHGWIPFDVPFISEITPGLWQGGCEDGLVLPGHIKHVVSLFPRGRYDVEHDVASETYVRMADSTEQAMEQVPLLAAWVNQCRKDGPVLVSCQAGLNRSSLVVASALMLDGMTAGAAIELIREKRSPACLCNPAFEEWLRGHDDALAPPLESLWKPGDDRPIVTRTVNSLRRADMRTIGDVTGWTEADLMDLRNFGDAQLSELKQVLAAAGLSLREEPVP
jgi:protein-tyrosine phosphatase